ncbi:MAG: hypothetical protein MJE77_46285 [Proteobacteria bacterium]|nr:hypothetical protein [Pseudomonadota bacterium]
MMRSSYRGEAARQPDCSISRAIGRIVRASDRARYAGCSGHIATVPTQSRLEQDFWSPGATARPDDSIELREIAGQVAFYDHKHWACA